MNQLMLAYVAQANELRFNRMNYHRLYLLDYALILLGK